MRKLISIFILLLSTTIYSLEVTPFNFTIVPYVNLLPDGDVTTLATGFISSNVHSVSGIQASPIFNTTTGKVFGLQGAGVFNIALDSVKGIQGSGVFNINHQDFWGVQTSGVFNISNGDFKGIQSSGVFNIANGDFYGIQAAGVFNISGNNVRTLQAAGVYNISGDLKGLQVAGLFNIAGKVNGAQLGTINIANGIDGLQVGVVNISTGRNNKAVPIGLINLYDNGTKNIIVYTDLDNNTYYGIETGSKNFYTQLFTGTKQENWDSLRKRIVGYGFGFKLLNYIDLVLGAKNYINHWRHTTPFGKASLGLKFGALSIFGGIEGDMSIDGYNDNSYFFSYDRRKYKLDEDIDIYYNYFIGVKLHL